MVKFSVTYCLLLNFLLFFMGIWSSFLTDLLSPELVGVIGTRIHVRSYSQWGAHCYLDSNLGSHGCKPSSWTTELSRYWFEQSVNTRQDQCKILLSMTHFCRYPTTIWCHQITASPWLRPLCRCSAFVWRMMWRRWRWATRMRMKRWVWRFPSHKLEIATSETPSAICYSSQRLVTY